MKTKLVIFGITGDLATRKLLPALDRVIKAKGFDVDIEIIGVSRHDVDVSTLLQSSLGNTDLADKMSMFSMSLVEEGDYVKLKEYVHLQDDEQLLIYLAVPPQASTQIVDYLGEAGINTPNVKILFEKPFGVDLASAHETIERTAQYFDEDQIYRIDHYLAKEMTQNIVAFRGRNALFNHIWNNVFIESIEIVAIEKIDIEGRAQFYEQTGALRDVVQGHLMQLLALTLMDTPQNFDWSMLPDLRLHALEQVEVADPERAIRAQYKGYQDAVGNPGSVTETFVSLHLTSNQPRWQDVDITLTTGKALDVKTTEVRINLKDIHEAKSNQITFHIQPNEGIDVEVFTKEPGYDRKFETQHLSYTIPEDVTLPSAYEQVIVDAIRSHKSLFACSGEVLRAWEILQPLQTTWGMDDNLPMYAIGSTPEAVIHHQS